VGTGGVGFGSKGKEETIHRREESITGPGGQAPVRGERGENREAEAQGDSEQRKVCAGPSDRLDRAWIKINRVEKRTGGRKGRGNTQRDKKETKKKDRIRRGLIVRWPNIAERREGTQGMEEGKEESIGGGVNDGR